MQSKITLIIKIVLFSVIVTMLVPAVFSYFEGTFTKNDMVKKIKTDKEKPICCKPILCKELESFINKRLHVDATVVNDILLEDIVEKRIDKVHHKKKQIISDTTDSIGASLIRLNKIDTFENATSTNAPHYRIVPFNESPQLILACLLYISVLTLIFVHPPRRKIFEMDNGKITRKKNNKGEGEDDVVTWENVLQPRTFVLAVVIFLFFYSELLIRNFFLNTSPLRKVYAYPNLDIGPKSFVVDFCINLLFALLLAVLWRQWMEAKRRMEEDNKKLFSVIEGLIETPPKNYNELQTKNNFIKHWKEVLFTRMLGHLSLYFTRWQERSVILLLGFVAYPAYYYVLLNKYNDHRYFIGAITAHILWLITWILISLPVINMYMNWNKDKHWILHFFDEGVFGKDSNLTYEGITERVPFSGVAFIIAAVAALVSFLFPLLKLL